MAKKPAPETPASLLAAIAARPDDRVKLFAASLTGPGEKAIQAALKDNAALRAALRLAIADLEALDEAPWLVQYVKRVDLREAIPELLRVARTDKGSKSEQAAQALLALGDKPSLEALAKNVESQRWTHTQSIQALFALGDEAAFARLSRDVAAGGRTASATLWHLAGNPEIVGRDPRWLDVAVAALRTTEGAEAARDVLAKTLTPELRRARYAVATPCVAPRAASAAALTTARAVVDAMLTRMPPFPKPRPTTLKRLEALDEIVGRVPPIVRALHERLDGLDIPGKKSSDRVFLYSTVEILKAARAWDRAHDPRHTPRDLVPAFLWPVAPDGFTKAGLSGGPPYAFELPGDLDDPVLSNTPKKPRYSQLIARELKRAARNLAGHP